MVRDPAGKKIDEPATDALAQLVDPLFGGSTEKQNDAVVVQQKTHNNAQGGESSVDYFEDIEYQDGVDHPGQAEGDRLSNSLGHPACIDSCRIQPNCVTASYMPADSLQPCLLFSKVTSETHDPQWITWHKSSDNHVHVDHTHTEGTTQSSGGDSDNWDESRVISGGTTGNPVAG